MIIEDAQNKTSPTRGDKKGCYRKHYRNKRQRIRQPSSNSWHKPFSTYRTNRKGGNNAGTGDTADIGGIVEQLAKETRVQLEECKRHFNNLECTLERLESIVDQLKHQKQ